MEIECEVEKGEEIDIVCPRCSGSGKTTIEIQGDDPMVVDCKWCDGTGISTAIVGADQIFYQEIDESEIVGEMEPAIRGG